MAISSITHFGPSKFAGSVTALALGSILAACGSAASSSSATSSPATTAPATTAPATTAPATTLAPTTTVPAEDVALQIQTGKMDGKPGWPRFTPSDISIHQGAAVTLTITNYDDGPAPLQPALATYENITGGTESVNGTATTNIPNADISHTFSVPGLGINAVIPVVPEGKKSVTVTFTFTPTKTGTFTWHCFAPCGSGSDGMTGAMSTMDWMQGNVTVS